jgi:antitoxin MazE
MHVTAQKWGNSLAIRIPKSYTTNANIEEGSKIDLVFENGCIVMKPVQKIRKTLDELLSKVTPENIHAETQTGDIVGREIW